MNANYRERLKDKKRIVIKIGSSSLIHAETGRLDFHKLEILARELSDLHNQGKDVVLVSSGAIAVGAAALGMKGKPAELEKKQACAAVGRARQPLALRRSLRSPARSRRVQLWDRPG